MHLNIKYTWCSFYSLSYCSVIFVVFSSCGSFAVCWLRRLDTPDQYRQCGPRDWKYVNVGFVATILAMIVDWACESWTSSRETKMSASFAARYINVKKTKKDNLNVSKNYWKKKLPLLSFTCVWNILLTSD